MTLASKIEFFDSINLRTIKLKKYIGCLEQFYLKKNSSLKINKENDKKIKAVINLFNETTFSVKNDLKTINLNEINTTEKQFVENNFYVQTTLLKRHILEFKKVQEKNQQITKENLKLNGEIKLKNKKYNNKVKKRHENLQEIIKNIEFLTEILSEMNEMVEKNKDVLDKIEVEVNNSVILSEKGANDLNDTLTYAKRINFLKKMIAKTFGVVALSIFVTGFLFFLPLIIF